MRAGFLNRAAQRRLYVVSLVRLVDQGKYAFSR